MSKNIYLLGDSIRMGYAPFVKELLADRAEVFQPSENGRWAGYTLNNLVKHCWLQELPDHIDIIHWNNGIWDRVIRHEEDGPFSSIEYYTDCLRKIIRVLRNLSPNIIFATSTPPREDYNISPIYGFCTNSLDNAIKYNEAALCVMKDENIEINDLYSLVYPNREQFITDDNTHLTEAGNRACALQIIQKLEKYLN